MDAAVLGREDGLFDLTGLPATALDAQYVKGREAPVFAYKIMGGR